jgi:DNA-binding transcriptional MerR regulator
MRIGTVAQEAGVNIQTVRYYERRGLLPETSRLPSGYRDYGPATVSLIRFIKNAQELGFSLLEIGELIGLRANRSRSHLEVRGLASAKIEEVNRRIAQLECLRNELRALVEECKAKCPGTECVIIEALDDSSAHDAGAGRENQPNGGIPCCTPKLTTAAATVRTVPVRVNRAARVAGTAADRRQRRNA